MNRRDCFALPLLLAGCGGDVEYQIQPSPFLRTSKQVYGQGTDLKWTPTITFAVPGNLSVSYTFQQGVALRIGSWHWIGLNLICVPTHTTASGALAIQGFPAPAISELTQFAGSISDWSGITMNAAYTQIGPVFISSAADTTSGTMSLRASGSGQLTIAIGATHIPSGGTLQFQISAFYKGFTT